MMLSRPVGAVLGLLLLAAMPAVLAAPGTASGTDSEIESETGSQIAVAADVEPASGYRIAPVASWVAPVVAFDDSVASSGVDSYGFHNRLFDYQFNGLTEGHSESYFASEYVLVNRYGVENHSTIEIEFDPTYESLVLHEVSLLRAGKVIDKLPTARRELLQRERDLDALIYDGTRTLAIVLDDVRVGDTIRYAYTIEGENPIFANLREFRVHTEYRSSLDRQHVRVLTPADRPLNQRVRGLEVDVQREVNGGVEMLSFDQRAVPRYQPEEGVPSWRNDRGTIVFSDVPDWQAVVAWSLPMYRQEGPVPEELRSIASAIRIASSDEVHQIGAALRWVQDEVRYFGVELGAGSHEPSLPRETLQRRFGDCKDKTRLLIALLGELGFAAEPALVNTDRGLESDSYPYRLHAFDHVIVHLEYDGRSHWLDPTLGYQEGALGEFAEPDFGRALIVSDDSDGLVDMNPAGERRELIVTKALNLPQGDTAASLTITSDRQGRLAERIRRSLDTTGIEEMGSNWEQYYRDFFPGARARQSVALQDSADNRVSTTERYDLDDFWLQTDEDADYQWLYADEIIGYLDKPDDVASRQQAYELVHPIDVSEIWQVKLPRGMRLDDLDAELDTDWFRFSKSHQMSEGGELLQVTQRFQSLTNEVLPEDMARYAAAVDEVEDLASFYLEDSSSLIDQLAAGTLRQGNTDKGALALLGKARAFFKQHATALRIVEGSGVVVVLVIVTVLGLRRRRDVIATGRVFG